MPNLLDPTLPITFYKHASFNKARAAIIHVLNLIGEASPECLAAALLSADLYHFNKYGRPVYGETWISEGDSHLPYAYLGSLAEANLRENVMLVSSWERHTMSLVSTDKQTLTLHLVPLSDSDREELSTSVNAIHEDGLSVVIKRLLGTAFVRSASDGRPLDWRMAIPGAHEGLTDRQVAHLLQEALFGQF